MQQSDKELIQALRTLAKDMNDMPGGYGRNTAERLRAAADRLGMLAQGMNDEAKADRIIQLEREKHDIMHLWYKGKEMCAICAHKCRNAEAKSCEECYLECPCPMCEGECWEEAQNNG